MPSSRHFISRLLTLLCVLLLGYISAHTVNGSTGNIWGFPSKANALQGGSSYVKEVRLTSLCSNRLVQMGTRRKQGRRRGQGANGPSGANRTSRVGTLKKIVNALGRESSKYTNLLFLSQGPGGLVQVYGGHAHMYLCFNRRGRLIIRHDVTDDGRCLFKEQPIKKNLMLQSETNPLWYVGFNRRGRRMMGFRKNDPRRRKCYEFVKADKMQHKNRQRHEHNRYGWMDERGPETLFKWMRKNSSPSERDSRR